MSQSRAGLYSAEGSQYYIWLSIHHNRWLLCDTSSILLKNFHSCTRVLVKWMKCVVCIEINQNRGARWRRQHLIWVMIHWPLFCLCFAPDIRPTTQPWCICFFFGLHLRGFYLLCFAFFSVSAIMLLGCCELGFLRCWEPRVKSRWLTNFVTILEAELTLEQFGDRVSINRIYLDI